MEHIVLFTFKKHTTPAAIDELLAGVRSLKDRISVVQDLSVGVNFTDRGKGYTHGLVVRFKARQDLETYLQHPAHLEVLKLFRTHTELVLAVDYEAQRLRRTSPLICPISSFLVGVGLGVAATYLARKL